MSKVNYPKSSPYSATAQSNRFLGRYVHRRIPAHETDMLITLESRHERRPEVLSQELYGTPEYYWVFMCRNMNIIRDPIWDFVPGTVIVAPSRSHLKSITG